MAVPPFQTFFRPFLALLSGGGQSPIQELRARLAEQFKLTPEELAQRTPSGQSTLMNRVAWTQVYLLKAGLIERLTRGTYRITDAGRRVLESHPTALTIADLRGVPPATDEPDEQGQARAGDGTPEEAMARCEGELRQLVETELHQRLAKMTSSRFEYLVEQLVVKLGYGSSDDEVRRALGGGHGDGGVDGVINEDRLGLGQIYLQAKRWENTVGRPELQKFVGAMHGRAQKGVFITSGEFSRDAGDYARNLQGMKLRLIDGAELVRLMVDCGLGVAESRRYTQFRIDNDFFDEGE